MNLRDSNIIVIGSSAGGLEALSKLLKKVRQVKQPIILVQHMAIGAEDGFAEVLSAAISKPVQIIKDKLCIEAGQIYLAPSNYHTLVNFDLTFTLDLDEKVNYSRPSIDVLFESCAEVYGDKVTGIILTGANADGCNGLYLIKMSGGNTLVQSIETAHIKTMPNAAIKKCDPDFIGDLSEIAGQINLLADRI